MKILKQLINGSNLTEMQAQNMMRDIMDGKYSSTQIGALLVALRMKGESVDEITGCAKIMRQKASDINLPGLDLIDTCGTGGDGGLTYNVSTASAFVLAAAGLHVAKHGNRSVSSKCGSADVLEKLGVKIDLPPESAAFCIREINIGFMFAPIFHKAMKYAVPPRRELAVRTIFNMLGPLTNPAKACFQVIGVYDAALIGMFAQVLKRMGIKRAMVVHGMDGMDEITLCDKTKVCELKADGSIIEYIINPQDYKMTLCDLSDVSGGNCDDNANIIKDIFAGKKGARRNLLCLNAGAALYISGKCKSIQKGIDLSNEIIDSGAANDKLEQFIRVSSEA